MKTEIWIGTVELEFATLEAPRDVKRAFTVITAWASSIEEFSKKAKQMLEQYGWLLSGVEEAAPVSEDREFDSEVADMIERTRENSAAVIYGTFHTYRRHDA